VSYTNGLKIERFNNKVRSDVENNSTGPADSISVSVNGAEAVPNDNINNYASRMSGWFIPPPPALTCSSLVRTTMPTCS
jgi:hypothetical protein